MPHQVKRFQSAKDYTEARRPGVPVSEKLNTWGEAERIRDRLRLEDPRHYYNIVHYTGCVIIETEE
jgi:hypothetical protein